MIALGTDLVKGVSWRNNVADERHVLETDADGRGQPEIGRIVGTEIHLTKAAQHEGERIEDAIPGVSVTMLGKVLQLLWIMAAVHERCDLANLKRREAEWALVGAH